MTGRRLEFVSPCTATGASFVERNGQSHCLQCDTVVHDLTSMTRREAERLVLAHGGRLCARARRNRHTQELVFERERPIHGPAGALVALALAACDGGTEEPPAIAPIAETAPSTAEPTAPAEPPVTAPPTTEASATEPSAVLAEAAEAPAPADEPSADGAAPDEAGEPTSSPTDASPDPAHHRTHRHRHAPARVAEEEEMVMGALEF